MIMMFYFLKNLNLHTKVITLNLKHQGIIKKDNEYEIKLDFRIIFNNFGLYF